MDKLMMKCGHAANATNGKGEPSCVICIGIHPGAEEIAETPVLANRKSHCAYYMGCKTEKDSNTNLPFFQHKPDHEFDQHYCGCKGWN